MLGNNLQNEVVRQLKFWRRKRGLSQMMMAEALHVSLKTYQNLENASTKMDLERLMQVAGILNVDIRNLLGIQDKSGSAATEDNLAFELVKEKERYIARLEQDIVDLRGILSSFGLLVSPRN